MGDDRADDTIAGTAVARDVCDWTLLLLLPLLVR
jgi:hypothetical protein